ncbi:hypothetical protein [Synechococcus elongatus]|uniref:hypothetical protein n=1 Tax=Synechococcus elongatus TaxID=32046 RepID=UPI000F7EB00A|nr:hypothetical protein [Synechococcus elongatus]
MAENEADYFYDSSHSIHVDEDGKGILGAGVASGTGFTIAWEDPRMEPEDLRTGAIEAEVIDAVIDRLSFYEHDGDFKDNAAIKLAIFHLGEALDALENRQAIAEAATVEKLEKAWQSDAPVEGRDGEVESS